MGVQSEQVGTEHTTLGDSSVMHWSKEGLITNLECLETVCKEIQHSVAEYISQAQGARFSKELYGGGCIEVWNQ